MPEAEKVKTLVMVGLEYECHPDWQAGNWALHYDTESTYCELSPIAAGVWEYYRSGYGFHEISELQARLLLRLPPVEVMLIMEGKRENLGAR